MNEKKKILYLGLHPPCTSSRWIHAPIIQINPRPLSEIAPGFAQAVSCTHLLLTSPTALTLTFRFANEKNISFEKKIFIVIGKGTKEALLNEGRFDCDCASIESSEGVCELLDTLDLGSAHLFYPHSSLSRPVISNYLQSKKIKTTECVLYDTGINPCFLAPSLEAFEEIFFTSPSTVDAFLHFYGYFPENKKLKTIGPYTQYYLDKKRSCLNVRKTD